MSLPIRRSLTGSAIALLLGLSALAAPAGTAAATGGKPSVDANDPAVAHLTGKYGMSTAEAIRRLTHQDSAPGVDAEARRALGSAFAGTWIDQGNGGDIVVDTTDAAKARTLRSRPGVRVRVVRYGPADIAAVRAELDAAADENVQVFMYVRKANAIEVRLAKGARMPAAVTRVVAKYPGAVKVERGRLEASHAAGCYYTRYPYVPYCDAPLRGGVGMTYYPSTGGTAGSCTTGFLARSKTDNTPFMMTAGHCSKWDGTQVIPMRTGGKWRTQTPGVGSSMNVVGDNHNAILSANTDAGLVRIDHTSIWNPENWVYSNNGAEISDYTITAIGGTTDGMLVCHTGAAIMGTDCGEVLGVPYSDPDVIPQNVALVDGCTIKGDSGGPAYKSHTAYGIVSGGYWSEGVNPSFYCSFSWFYVGITYAANALNVNVATS